MTLLDTNLEADPIQRTKLRLVGLIHKNKEEIINSSLRRRQTSLYNKPLHTKMLEILEKDSPEILDFLGDKSYNGRVLRGVIVCSDAEQKDLWEMLDLQEELRSLLGLSLDF